jgi:5'-nucleotidase/UDP-sugar diphosphatase
VTDTVSPVVGGAANILSWWVDSDGFDAERDLLLSGGDSWTGPSISTWFFGEPTVEVFNLMGYHASAVGNHEFDFGREVMVQRFTEADYPYLAANIRFADTGERVDFAQPWVMLDANGIQVGVLGLATTSSAVSAHPIHVSDLVFDDYGATIDEMVPQMREAGAQIIILLTHICPANLGFAVSQAEADVDLALAGHCHSLSLTAAGTTPVVSSGWAFRSYGRIVLTYDHPTESVTDVDAQLFEVQYPAAGENPVEPDPDVDALVSYWQAEADAILDTQIGYTNTGIAYQTWPQANWVTDTWLVAYPEADLAIQNFGGLRQSILTGPITVGDIVGMMPFDNVIYLLELTGQQVLDNLSQALEGCVCPGNCCPAVAGMTVTTNQGFVQATLEGGTPLDPVATYQVLVQDYIYHGGGGYLFWSQDPNPIDLGVNYRQSVVDWTTAQGTTAGDPLEDHIDPNPRVQ